MPTPKLGPSPAPLPRGPQSPRTPSPCSLARPARPPPPRDDRGAGVSQTATAACSHRPANGSRDSWSGPCTSPRHCHPVVPPETPTRGASCPEGNLPSKPHGLALSPNGQEPRAPRGTSELCQRPATSTAAGGAGHQAPGSQCRAPGAAEVWLQDPGLWGAAPALRNGAGEGSRQLAAGSRPRARGRGFSLLPGPSRPLRAQPHPPSPSPAPAPSRL